MTLTEQTRENGDDPAAVLGVIPSQPTGDLTPTQPVPPPTKGDDEPDAGSNQPTGDGPAPARASWPDDRPSHAGYAEPWS